MVGVIAFKKRCMIAIKDQPGPYFISDSGAVLRNGPVLRTTLRPNWNGWSQR